MDIDAPGILMDIGITNATNVLRPPHLKSCELWAGDSDSLTATTQRTRVLILHSGFSAENVDAAKQSAKNIDLVLFEDSALARDLEKKVQTAFPDARVLTIGNALRHAIFRGLASNQPNSVDYYVPPTIVPAAGMPPIQSALVTLFQWMRGTSTLPDAPSRVGVLLGPAGTGKTALAIELINVFLRHYPVDAKLRQTVSIPFPILIDRLSWIDHEFRDTTDNLADLIGNSLYKQYRFQPPIDKIQRCLRYGAICTILDGFDELCATKPFHFGADDTIAELVRILDGVDGSRILLTCRESFWHDNVDITLRAKLTAFRLNPFSEVQRDEYLTKRFPAESDQPKKSRTISLLNRIAELHVPSVNGQNGSEIRNLSYLPWVVQFAAESSDSSALESSSYDSVGTTPNIDPLGHVLWQFCRREQQRIGIALEPQDQVMFFSNLAAITGEWFPIDQVNSLYDVLFDKGAERGGSENVKFLRRHGLLHIVGDETPNNCRFEYPEVQDYLRARIAVDSICGAASVLGDDDVFRRCAAEQVRLVDFISILLRWRLPLAEIAARMAPQRRRFVAIENENGKLAAAGLLQILVRTLRDGRMTPREVMAHLCRYFGATADNVIEHGYFYGLFSRLDFSGVKVSKTTFKNVHIEHSAFDKETMFINCEFEEEFTAALNCTGLGDVSLIDCTYSKGALSTFRLHQNRVGRIDVDRPHIDFTCGHILGQFQIGQSGFRSKSYEDVLHEAKKVSPIGEDVLGELIGRGVLRERRGGTRVSLEVAERGAVSSFLQQSILRGAMVEVIDRLVRRHLRKEK
jgi:hypothetical protein